MKQAVIFDLDGTLANTLDSITYFVNATMTHFGLPGITPEQTKVFVGNGAKELIERALSAVGGEALEFDTVLDYYKELYNSDPFCKLTVYDGVTEMLDTLKKAGVRLAVLSNKPHEATLPIGNYLFGERMDVICGQKEGVPVKPDITALMNICDELGVAPKDCVYVGDTWVDMKTGTSAGMLTVGVLWGFRGREELEQNGADVIVSHPDEITKLVWK